MIDFSKKINNISHVSLVRQFQACVCVVAPLSSLSSAERNAERESDCHDAILLPAPRSKRYRRTAHII